MEKATAGQQLPWVSSSPISGNFYFTGKPVPAIVNAGTTPAPATPEPSHAGALVH